MEEKEGVNPAGMASVARRVLVVDDSVLVRQGLRSILESSSELSVIGEAENGIESVSMASHFRPDVIVMDVNMPGMNGIEATKHIKAAQPAILVIGFSVNDDPHVQAAMREAGADAFLTKGAASTQLCDAIATLAHERRVERIDQER
jgi:DNA-binding NarL/FixJ family response regulator